MKTLSALLLLGLSACSSVSPAKIAYNVLSDAEAQNYEVFVMDADGSNATNITQNSAIDWVYLAHGDSLFFLSDRGECRRCFYLYEMNSQGKNVRRISDIRMADSWLGQRRGGTELIVKPHSNELGDFLILNRDGTVLDSVSVELPYASDPAFSPDGKAIVFRGAQKASPRVADFSDELYVLRLDGSTPTRITSHPERLSGKPWAGYRAAAPRWREDGKITFASIIDGKYNIYEINPDGSERRVLINMEGNQVFHDHNEADSSEVSGAMIYDQSPNNRDGYELYLRRADGTVQRLTNDAVEQYAPVFVTPSE